MAVAFMIFIKVLWRNGGGTAEIFILPFLAELYIRPFSAKVAVKEIWNFYHVPYIWQIVINNTYTMA